jgi:hypothetical protein
MSAEGRQFNVAIAQESWEEIVHNNVPLDHGPEELELGGAECYATVEDQPVIFDDEPRNPAELARHPERGAILVSTGKEIDQLIEQEIGVEVTPAISLHTKTQEVEASL